LSTKVKVLIVWAEVPAAAPRRCPEPGEDGSRVFVYRRPSFVIAIRLLQGLTPDHVAQLGGQVAVVGLLQLSRLLIPCVARCTLVWRTRISGLSGGLID
jgi:hypothetical protein